MKNISKKLALGSILLTGVSQYSYGMEEEFSSDLNTQFDYKAYEFDTFDLCEEENPYRTWDHEDNAQNMLYFANKFLYDDVEQLNQTDKDSELDFNNLKLKVHEALYIFERLLTFSDLTPEQATTVGQQIEMIYNLNLDKPINADQISRQENFLYKEKLKYIYAFKVLQTRDINYIHKIRALHYMGRCNYEGKLFNNKPNLDLAFIKFKNVRSCISIFQDRMPKETETELSCSQGGEDFTFDHAHLGSDITFEDLLKNEDRTQYQRTQEQIKEVEKFDKEAGTYLVLIMYKQLLNAKSVNVFDDIFFTRANRFITDKTKVSYESIVKLCNNLISTLINESMKLGDDAQKLKINKLLEHYKSFVFMRTDNSYIAKLRWCKQIIKNSHEIIKTSPRIKEILKQAYLTLSKLPQSEAEITTEILKSLPSEFVGYFCESKDITFASLTLDDITFGNFMTEVTSKIFQEKPESEEWEDTWHQNLNFARLYEERVADEKQLSGMMVRLKDALIPFWKDLNFALQPHTVLREKSIYMKSEKDQVARFLYRQYYSTQTPKELAKIQNSIERKRIYNFFSYVESSSVFTAAERLDAAYKLAVMDKKTKNASAETLNLAFRRFLAVFRNQEASDELKTKCSYQGAKVAMKLGNSQEALNILNNIIRNSDDITKLKASILKGAIFAKQYLDTGNNEQAKEAQLILQTVEKDPKVTLPLRARAMLERAKVESPRIAISIYEAILEEPTISEVKKDEILTLLLQARAEEESKARRSVRKKTVKATTPYSRPNTQRTTKNSQKSELSDSTSKK